MKTFSPSQLNNIAQRLRTVAQQWLETEHPGASPEARDKTIRALYADLQRVDASEFPNWFSRRWGLYTAAYTSRPGDSTLAELLHLEPEMVQSLTFLALGSLCGGSDDVA